MDVAGYKRGLAATGKGTGVQLVEEIRRLEHVFPNLANADYKITSPFSFGYNCVAWALGFNDLRRDCEGAGSYWPPNIPRNMEMGSLILLFSNKGYMV